MEKIGVVTVTFNSANVLRPFLNNLFDQTFSNFDLYVIDNNSNDATIKILDEFDDNRIIIIKNDKNIGVAAANNVGIKKAFSNKCSHILLLNNDIEFPNSLLNDMYSSINNNSCSLLVLKYYIIVIKTLFGMLVEVLKKVMVIYLFIMDSMKIIKTVIIRHL